MHCKGNLTLDKTKRKADKIRTCRCDGYSYPHRSGTEPWCNQAKIGPTEADFEERYYGISNRSY